MNHEKLIVTKALLMKSRARRRRREKQCNENEPFDADNQAEWLNKVNRNSLEVEREHSLTQGQLLSISNQKKLRRASRRLSKNILQQDSMQMSRLYKKRKNVDFDAMTQHEMDYRESMNGNSDQIHGKLKGKAKFRRLGRRVIICRQFCNVVKTALTHEEGILFFLDIPNAALNVGGSNAVSQTRQAAGFDINSYRGIKEQNTLLALKNLLITSPTTRSKQTVNAALHLLQGYTQFAGYPIPAQRKICQLAFYSRFDTTTVVCRQGQPAEVFYFILSGVAIARSMDDPSKGNRRKQKAAILRRGDTIGEKELLDHAPREVTIITKEPVEVMGLDKEEYIDIFRSVRGEGMDYLDFLKSVPDLEPFPLYLLPSNQAACSLNYYRRGTVMVKNSKQSDWVYVVKQGSCQVFKPILPPRDEAMEEAIPQHITEEVKPSNHLVLPVIQLQKAQTPRKDGLTQSNLNRRKSVSDGQLNALPKINQGDQQRLVQRPMDCFDEAENDNEDEAHSEQGGKSGEEFQRQISSRSEGSTPTTAYAKLDVIIEKDVFGLQSLIYEDTPSLSLVSNGAECVVISKQFLIDNLDAYILSQLRKNLAPYPSVTVLQSTLENRLQWNMYKERVLRKKLETCKSMSKGNVG